MALSVIGAGYPRTGTATLKLALEQLGFGPCHHMREVIMNPPSAQLWVEAAEGRPDWDAIFANYRSCTDAPACTFWRELADVYPDAKILLSVRDAEAWFESTQATVFGPLMGHRAIGTPMERFFRLCVFKDFGDQINDRDFMLAQFARHTEEVKRLAPPERLLVFDVREGWEPLCSFLGVAVPEGPFPKTNTREEMAALQAAIGGREPGKPFDFDQLSKLARERFGGEKS
jgi:hypothetical protein